MIRLREGFSERGLEYNAYVSDSFAILDNQV